VFVKEKGDPIRKNPVRGKKRGLLPGGRKNPVKTPDQRYLKKGFTGVRTG